MSSRRAKRRLRIIALSLVAAIVAVGMAGFVAFALAATAPKAADESVSYKPIKAEFVPHLLVIGDSFTGGSNEDGFEENGWPALIQSAYTKDGARLQLNLLGRGGAGYVTKGQIKETFGQSYAGNAFEDQDVIVVIGGLNDSDKPADAVGAGAAKLYEELQVKSPKAKLLVVGPAWPNAEPVPNVFEVRDAIKTAATSAGATFIDPLADGWFTGKHAALIGKDQTHPTDAGHTYMAGILSPPITATLSKVVAANK